VRLSMKRNERRNDPKSNPRPVSEVAPKPQQAQQQAPATTPEDLPEELIAARAYEIWESRGCPMGQDGASDWYAARQELEQERLRFAAPEESDRDRI
jgi:hypothetical protein